MGRVVHVTAASRNHNETNVGGTEAGLDKSTDPEELRGWLEQLATRGVETGVKPVPPSIKESKLKGIPADGVVIGTPATSETETFALSALCEGVKAAETGREFGREGFAPAVATLARAGRFAGNGWL